MIELERDESQDIQVWADADFRHVIVQEPGTTLVEYLAPGWYVRDEGGEYGPYGDLAEALVAAQGIWDVTLAPANRLRRDIEDGDENDGMQHLTEYLAEHGTVGIDPQALAQRIFERLEG
jgi:hypothetical protein